MPSIPATQTVTVTLTDKQYAWRLLLCRDGLGVTRVALDGKIKTLPITHDELDRWLPSVWLREAWNTTIPTRLDKAWLRMQRLWDEVVCDDEP